LDALNIGKDAPLAVVISGLTRYRCVWQTSRICNYHTAMCLPMLYSPDTPGYAP